MWSFVGLLQAVAQPASSVAAVDLLSSGEYGIPMASPSGSGSLPGALPLLGHFPAYTRDPLGFVTRVAAEHGGVVPFRLGPYPALLLTDPDAISEVLVAKSRDFRKSRAAGRIGVVVGDGLLLTEGETWRAHRRVVQPAFQHDRVAGWGETIVRERGLRYQAGAGSSRAPGPAGRRVQPGTRRAKS
jgi:hypothetical protein